MTWLAAWQVARVAETAAVGTTVGCVIGRLLLPHLWRDIKEWRRRQRAS